MQATKIRNDLWMDLGLMAFLIGLDVVARLLPPAWGFLPIAASGFFAGRVLKHPALAVVVPLVAMAVSDAFLQREATPTMFVIYVALALPALAGMLTRSLNGAVSTIAIMTACSLIFFAASNFAVWAFSTMYPHTLEGLTQCYILALPFLEKTVMGDLLWTGVLFGGYWLVQHAPSLVRRAH